MKAKPVKLVYGEGYFNCSIEDATHVELNFPSPFFQQRHLPVILRGARDGTNCWSWNGDTEKPTLKPSIKTECNEMVCHSFVNDGMVQFLSDCSHDLAGQTVDMLDIT